MTKRPVGWRKDPARHALASKGISMKRRDGEFIGGEQPIVAMPRRGRPHDPNKMAVGDKVLWRGAWGNDPPQVAVIRSIELVAPGQKENGTSVDEVPWAKIEEAGDMNTVVVDLSNGHWAYGYQLSRLKE